QAGLLAAAAGARAPAERRGQAPGPPLVRQADRLLGLGALGRPLGPRRDDRAAAPAGRGGELEGHVAPGGPRRLEADADEVEEGDEVLVRDLIQTEEVLLRHPGEQLDEGDARIADVVIGPGWAIARDVPLRLVD